MDSRRWISVGLVVAGVVAFVCYLIQRQETVVLRSEVAMLQQEQERAVRLRAEHDRLLASKVSDEELQRLRNDRAALNRLRNEISASEASADRMAQRSAQEAAIANPAQLMKISFGSDGGLLLDGAPVDNAGLRQQMAKFAESAERVEISLRLGVDKMSVEAIKPAVETIARYGKELGLKYTMRFEKPPK